MSQKIFGRMFVIIQIIKTILIIAVKSNNIITFQNNPTNFS